MAVVGAVIFQKCRHLGTGALEDTCQHCKVGYISQHSVLNVASDRFKLCFRRSASKVKCTRMCSLLGVSGLKVINVNVPVLVPLATELSLGKNFREYFMLQHAIAINNSFNSIQ